MVYTCNYFKFFSNIVHKCTGFVLRLIPEKNCAGSYNYPYYQSCDHDRISSNIQRASAKNLFWGNSWTNRNTRAMKTLFSIFMGLGEHHLFKNDTIDSVFLQFFRNFSELSFWEHLQTDYMFWIREAALQSWFLEKGVLKIWCKFTGAQPCRRNQTSVWVFCYKLASYFQNTFD